MSNPSFSNIDRWLFELREGNLTPEQIAQLEAFLIRHPELDIDKDMWELASVDAEPIEYPHQDKLLKERRPVAMYLVASVVGIFIFASGFLFWNNSTELKANQQSQFQAQLDKAYIHQTNQTSKSQQTNVYTSSTNINQLNGNSEYQSESQNNTNVSTYDATSTNGIDRSITTSAVNTVYVNQTSNFSTGHVSNGTINDTQNANSSNTTSGNPSTTVAYNALHPTVIRPSDVPSRSKLNAKVEKRSSEDVDNFEEFYPDWNYKRKESKNNLHLAHKLHVLQYKIKRMADNPVALINLKDPHYHVPGMSATDVNFSSVGTLLATRVQTQSRYQFMGMENEQLMNQLQVDGYNYGIRGGIGLTVQQSRYSNNAIQNTQAALTYSPKFSVNKNIVVEPSVRFKMGQKSINPDKLTAGQLVEDDRMNARQFYSVNQAPIGRKLWYKDLGAGLMINTKWFFVGGQVDNLMRHEDNVYSLDQTSPRRVGYHFTVSGGTDYKSKNEKYSLSPYIVYQKYESLSEAWLGASFRAHWFTVGGAISSNLEPAASIGLKFDHFAMTYNADYTNSILGDGNNLSHQLTLRFLSNPSRIGKRLLKI